MTWSGSFKMRLSSSPNPYPITTHQPPPVTPLRLSCTPSPNQSRRELRENLEVSAGAASWNTTCQFRPSAYVSIRQHTSAYVSISQHTSVFRESGSECRCSQLEYDLPVASAYASIRQHTSAYVSIRQHTSA